MRVQVCLIFPLYYITSISLAQGFLPRRLITWRLLWQSVPISLKLPMCTGALKKLTLWQASKKIRHFGPKSYESWRRLFSSPFSEDLANRRMSTDIPTSTGMISTLFYSFSQASDRNIIAIFIITILLPYNCWDSHFLSFRGPHLYRFLPCWQLRRNCAAAEEARAVSLQRDGQRATAPLQIQAWGETCAL